MITTESRYVLYINIVITMENEIVTTENITS